MSILQTEIKKFFTNEQKVADYRQAVHLLTRSGFLDLVRKFGFPSIIEQGKDLNAMAHEGSWSNGFQTAIHHVEHMEMLYANKPEQEKARLSPTFGGAAIAKKEGYLTSDELQKFIKGDKK